MLTLKTIILLLCDYYCYYYCYYEYYYYSYYYYYYSKMQLNHQDSKGRIKTTQGIQPPTNTKQILHKHRKIYTLLEPT